MAFNDRKNFKYAFVNATSLGSNEIIAAVTTNKIRVLALALVSTSTNTIKFLSASTDISSQFALAANGGMVLPYNEWGWFETVKNEALNINLSAASQVGVTLVYEEVF